MRIKVRRLRKGAAAGKNGRKGRQGSLRDLKVCFGPCRCYATGRKAKEV
jgi:hypothetical protein